MSKLVLTRRVGESLCIGKDVVVCIESVKGGQVRLSIDAPKEIEIVRDELVSDGRNWVPGDSISR